jgi:hypothetical protein
MAQQDCALGARATAQCASIANDVTKPSAIILKVQRRELTMPSNSILARRPHWMKRLRCKLFACYRANSVFAPREPERGVKGRAPQRSRQPISSAGPLLVAMLAGLAGIALIMAWRTALEDTLYIPRIDGVAAPTLDGDAPDAAWRLAKPITVLTGFGGNLGGMRSSAVEIRAVHDGKWIYFRFTWEDPTRSLKHLPLLKREDGWHVLHDRYDRADERSFFEDKFLVLLTNLPIVIPGDHTYRGGPAPIAQPGTERGQHLTSAPGLAMEVWQWKASSGGLLGSIDKNHFDLPADPTDVQTAGEVPYRGGYVQDSRVASLYGDNFEAQPVGGYERPVQPRRLPTDWRATYAALGKVDLEPDQGDSEGARWWMTMAESEPYSSDRDARIPVGTVIPGSLILAEDLGQRADIKGAARWGAGKWTLEVARRLDAEYPDVPIGSNTRMWVAVFDHAQTYRTRHVRPVHLQLQR